MKIKDALIAWNPETDQVAVGPLLYDGDPDWTRPYLMTGGASNVRVRSFSGMLARHFVMSEFIGIVVRDRCDAKAAHTAFLEIDEYREAIPEDMVPQKYWTSQ